MLDWEVEERQKCVEVDVLGDLLDRSRSPGRSSQTSVDNFNIQRDQVNVGRTASSSVRTEIYP
jgi:hypothetical protein